MHSIIPKLFIIAALALFSGSFSKATAAEKPGPISADAAPSKSPEVLDQKKIHANYNDGNFDKVLFAIEGFQHRNHTYSHEDSVFIAKHLAVVYSANPATREKGKYYMYQLLSLLPSAKLVDMYVSDEIDRIFDKVREEYLSRQKAFGVDSAQISVPEKSPSRMQLDAQAAGPAVNPPVSAQAKTKPKSKDEDEKIKTGYLIAGGTALVAVGVAAYFIFGDSPKAADKTYVVP